ncbi:MAG: MBL fold metallo-hydrolase [Solirubrobacteraceae bacterium]
MDVRTFTVGPVQENCHLARCDGAREAIVIDPGDEPERILGAIDALGLVVEAILLTHTHFDHVGAVAPVARATGAPVWCPEIEVPVLADIMSYVPWPGFGPFESYHADHTVQGGERLELAGLDIDVLFTPGHSPGHVSYAARDGAGGGRDAGTRGAAAGSAGGDDTHLFSGDVLFQGSIGRTDLPFGDAPTLMRSIATLLETFPDETAVYPGHMGNTTLGRERHTNPFLTEPASR